MLEMHQPFGDRDLIEPFFFVIRLVIVSQIDFDHPIIRAIGLVDLTWIPAVVQNLRDFDETLRGVGAERTELFGKDLFGTDLTLRVTHQARACGHRTDKRLSIWNILVRDTAKAVDHGYVECLVPVAVCSAHTHA